MQNEARDLSERLLDFGACVVKLCGRMHQSNGGHHIGNQMLRAATSSGANYEEACGAESRADFIHKMQIVLKELRESLYWLRLAHRARLISDEDLKPLIDEADSLAKIVGKSVVTAKRK